MRNFDTLHAPDGQNTTGAFSAKIAATLVAAALFVGCSSAESAHDQPEQLATSTTGTTLEPKPSLPPETDEYPTMPSDFEYDSTPSENFVLSDCLIDPRATVSLDDSDPIDIEEHERTIGLVKWYENGKPVLEMGAAIKGKGDIVYELATSDNPTEVITIDLGEGDGTFSQVLHGSEENIDYAAVLSARFNHDDGRVYFDLTCLPAHDYDGGMEVEPMQPKETVPPPTTTQPQIPVPDAVLINA